jgi:hypothetical protein
VFDEAVFPFQNLHPNAGALLRQEILLLDPSLHSFAHGDEHLDDLHADNSHTTNLVPSAPFVVPRVLQEICRLLLKICLKIQLPTAQTVHMK